MVLCFHRWRYNLGQYKYYATWRYNGSFYLIAVNASHDNSYNYEIPLPENTIGDPINFFPDRPDSLVLESGILTGELGPYQVAVYKMDTRIAVNDEIFVDRLCLLPNPAENSLRILGLSKTSRLEIFDLMGRKIISEIIDPNHALDLGDLGSGIYLVKVTSYDNPKSHQILRLIKK